MAILRLTAKVAGQVSKGKKDNGVSITKFKMESVINNRKSYFCVVAYGKLAEQEIKSGDTLMIEGDAKKELFQLTPSSNMFDGYVVYPSSMIKLPQNMPHEAKVYNLMANLIKKEPKKKIVNDNLMAFQTIIENNSKTMATPYTIFFYGKRGDALHEKGFLSQEKVKKVLVSGEISTSYTEKDGQYYLNIAVSPNDFKIVHYGDEYKSNNSSTGFPDEKKKRTSTGFPDGSAKSKGTALKEAAKKEEVKKDEEELKLPEREEDWPF